MAKIGGWEGKVSFNMGELNPELLFRTDLSKYTRGLKTAKNCIIKEEGVITNTPELEKKSSFASTGVLPTKDIRMFEFVFNETSVYDSAIVTLSPKRLNISGYTESTGSFTNTLKTFVTLYEDDELSKLDIVQIENTILITGRGRKPSMISIKPDITSSVELDFWNNLITKPTYRVPVDWGNLGNNVGLVWYNDSNNIFIIKDLDVSTSFEAKLSKDSLVHMYGGTFRLGDKDGNGVYKPDILKNPEIDIPKETDPQDIKEVDKRDIMIEVSLTGENNDKYPSRCSKFQNRLVLADFDSNRNAIAISVSGDSLNFQVGNKDDDGMVVFIPDERVDKINEIIPYNSLIFVTDFGLWSTGINTMLTPTQSQIFQQIDLPPSSGKYIKSNGELYIANERDNRIYKIDYNADAYTYVANEITLYSRHLFREGIEDIYDFEYEGNKYFMVNTMYENKHVNLVCTVNLQQNVIAWYRNDYIKSYIDFKIIPMKIQNRQYFFTVSGVDFIDVMEFSETEFQKYMEIELLPPLNSENMKSDLPFLVKDYYIDSIIVSLKGEGYRISINGNQYQSPFGYDGKSVHTIKDYSFFRTSENINIKVSSTKPLKILAIYYHISAENEISI